MTRRSLLGGLVLAAVLVLSLVGKQGERAEAQQKVVVRIAVQPFIIPSAIMRARRTLEQKYGDRYEIRWIDMTHAAPVIEAMVAGELDLGDTGTFPLIQARASGHDLWAVGDTIGDVTGLAVRPDVGIKTAKDLKGKHLAYPGKLSWQYGILRMVLEDAGLTVDDVKLSLVRFPEMPLLIEKKAIDGFVGIEPFLSLAITKGQATMLFRPSMKVRHKEGTLVSGNIVARAAFAKAHPDAVTAYLKEFQEASRWIRSHPREAAQSFNKILKGAVTEEVFMYAVGHGLVYFENVKPQYENMADLVRLTNKYGVTNITNVDDFVKGYVHPEFASW